MKVIDYFTRKSQRTLCFDFLGGGVLNLNSGYSQFILNVVDRAVINPTI